MDIVTSKLTGSRVHPVTVLDKISQADLVIEAATDNITLKDKIFKELDQHISEDAILASNTSSISITKLASFIKKPGYYSGTDI